MKIMIGVHFLFVAFFMHSVVFSQSKFHGEMTKENLTSNFFEIIEKREYRFAPGILRIPTEQQLQDLTVTWNQPAIDVLERYCTISGTLRTLNDQGMLVPIDWQQMIGIRFAVQAGATPDWSRAIDIKTAMKEVVFASEDGSFEAKFDLWNIESRLDEKREFQVGISLAEQAEIDGETLCVVYSSSAPVLEQSVDVLHIPPPAEIPPIVRTIAKVSSFPSAGANAVDLIRVANSLRLLGKEEALKAMEHYYVLSQIDKAPNQTRILYALAVCIFEPADPEGSIPDWSHYPSFADDAPFQNRETTLPHQDWPRLPIEILDNCPWVYGDAFIDRLDEADEKFFDWLRKRAVLRDVPLKPVENPIETVSVLLQEPRIQELDSSKQDLQERLRFQAYLMVKHLFQPFPQKRSGNRALEANWDELRLQAQELGLHWNERDNEYQLRQR